MHARTFFTGGYELVLATRSLERGNHAAEQLRAQHPNSTVTVMECDLGSLKSIRSFAERFISEKRHLELLVLNAGVVLSSKGVGVCACIHFHCVSACLCDLGSLKSVRSFAAFGAAGVECGRRSRLRRYGWV